MIRLFPDCPYWRDAKPIARLFGLRQQADREKQDPCFCISDFVAPVSAHKADYIGLFAVTAGIGDEERCKRSSSTYGFFIFVKKKMFRFVQMLSTIPSTGAQIMHGFVMIQS